MHEGLDHGLARRLTAASYALPLEEVLRELADDVASWDEAGLGTKAIDSRILKWGHDNGFDFDDWARGFEEEFPGHRDTCPTLDLPKLWKAMGFEDWLIACVRSLAFTDTPIHFHPLAAGFWMPIPNADPPLLIAYMTPLTDPDLAARQLKGQFEKVFGPKAARKTRSNEVENARMLSRHRQGMSYKEIAIQNLRDRYPDIVSRPSKYSAQIKTERERVIKAIAASQAVWKERLPDSSIDE